MMGVNMTVLLPKVYLALLVRLETLTAAVVQT